MHIMPHSFPMWKTPMPSSDAEPRGLRLILLRFPSQADDIRLAALRDRRFRSLCEDFALALEALARFEARPDAAERKEIPEYRTLVAELEAEVAGYLRDSIEH